MLDHDAWLYTDFEMADSSSCIHVQLESRHSTDLVHAASSGFRVQGLGFIQAAAYMCSWKVNPFACMLAANMSEKSGTMPTYGK